MTGEEFTNKFAVKCLFHFTDRRNLESIRAHGLLRLAELGRRALPIAAPGGNRWSHEEDARRGLDEYIHLCLLGEHPMEWAARQSGHIQGTQFLRIDRRILCVDGVRFASDVANKAGVPLLTLDEAAQSMDLEVIYSRTNWRDPAIQERRKVAKKYEALIPSDISLDLIGGL